MGKGQEAGQEAGREASMNKIRITLTVNGELRRVETEPNKTLLYLLRDDLGVHGVKDACGQEGECGACTVLLDGRPVNSCLVLAGQADGRQVVTVEGLAHDGRPHPVQRAFVEAGAVQCGFCTPGAVLSAGYLLQHEPHPTDEQIRDALSGNLCRCTGYTKMVAAVRRCGGDEPWPPDLITVVSPKSAKTPGPRLRTALYIEPGPGGGVL
jgi:carbon-monoxide dehydrogenase small subunit